MLNEGNQMHNSISSSGPRTVISYGSTSQKVTVPTVLVPLPVPQRWSGSYLSLWYGSWSYLSIWCWSGSKFGPSKSNAPKWPSKASSNFSLWCESGSCFSLWCGSGSSFPLWCGPNLASQNDADPCESSFAKLILTQIKTKKMTEINQGWH